MKRIGALAAAIVTTAAIGPAAVAAPAPFYHWPATPRTMAYHVGGTVQVTAVSSGKTVTVDETMSGLIVQHIFPRPNDNAAVTMMYKNFAVGLGKAAPKAIPQLNGAGVAFHVGQFGRVTDTRVIGFKLSPALQKELSSLTGSLTGSFGSVFPLVPHTVFKPGVSWLNTSSIGLLGSPITATAKTTYDGPVGPALRFVTVATVKVPPKTLVSGTMSDTTTVNLWSKTHLLQSETTTEGGALKLSLTIAGKTVTATEKLNMVIALKEVPVP